VTSGIVGRRWTARVQSLAVLLTLLLLNTYLEYRGAFEPFALASYDWFQSPSAPPSPAFSPLVTAILVGPGSMPETFRRADEGQMILRAIQMISCGHPAVIGVDWRSGTWNPETLDRLRSFPGDQTRIVWARERDKSGRLLPVAGGVSLPPNWTAGVGMVKLDKDRAVRRHVRWFEDGTETFSWTLLRAYCADHKDVARGCRLIKDCARKEDCESQPYLNYRDGSDRVNKFPLSAFPPVSGNLLGCSTLPESGKNPFFEGRIVLIGDATGGDTHETPYGAENGVVIMAHAVQNDLLGYGIAEPSSLLVFLLDLACVGVVLLSNHYFPPFRALIFNGFGIPIVAMAFSYFAFRSFRHWFNFVPLLGGVILHQLYEQAKENQKLRKETRDRSDHHDI
jgi:CHASE2 domain-containing sensor protein